METFCWKVQNILLFFLRNVVQLHRSQHSFLSGAGAKDGPSGLPYLESRFGVAQFHHPNILDLQSHFFMLFYSYRQHKIHYCIILTVNLLTWKKESPVFTEKQNHLFSHMTINIHLINNMGFLNFIDLSDIFDATLVKRNIVVILKNVPERENI